MLQFFGCSSGTPIHWTGIHVGAHMFYYVVADKPEQYRVINKLKGVMEDSPSCAHGFNDCHHYELYGNVSLIHELSLSGRLANLPIGYSYLWDGIERPEQIYSTIGSPTGWAFWSIWKVSTGYHCTVGWVRTDREGFMGLMSRARSRFPTLSDAEEYRDSQLRLPPSPTDWDTHYGVWHRPDYVGAVVRTGWDNNLSELGRAWMGALSASCPGADFLSEATPDLIRSALNSTQEIPTLSIACQVGLDGLVTQAAASIVASAPQLVNAGSVRDFLQSVGRLKLGIQWGILSPLNDYVELFKKLNDYYTYDYDESLGRRVMRNVTPFFWKASVARTTITWQSWTVRCVAGIQWDYLQGSSIEDLFGILHTAGLDLSFAQVWDLVPFSFAPDWVVNVTGALEMLDARLNAARYPVRYYWRSFRAERTIAILNQNVKFVEYVRRAEPRLPPVRQICDWPHLRGTLSSSNLDEAMAFIVNFL